jgi:hypothetical protein
VPGWRREYNEYFRGRRVAPVPDNDATGRIHMEEIASNLKGVATDIRLVDYRRARQGYDSGQNTR